MLASGKKIFRLSNEKGMYKVKTVVYKVKLVLTTSLNCPILLFEGAGKENFGVERADFFGMKGNSRVKDLEKIFKKLVESVQERKKFLSISVMSAPGYDNGRQKLVQSPLSWRNSEKIIATKWTKAPFLDGKIASKCTLMPFSPPVFIKKRALNQCSGDFFWTLSKQKLFLTDKNYF